MGFLYLFVFVLFFCGGKIGERLMSRIKKAGNVWNAERLMNRKERQGIVTEEDGWYLKRHYCRDGGITELREAASAGAGTRKIRRAGAVAGCDGGVERSRGQRRRRQKGAAVSAGGRKVRKTVLSVLRKAVSGMGGKVQGERRPQPARQCEKRSESGQRWFFIVNFSF